MVAVSGPDDNYSDSLRIPCFVLPNIECQYMSKPTSDPQKAEWRLGDRPWLAPRLSSLWGSRGLRSDTWGHLAPSGPTARISARPWLC